MSLGQGFGVGFRWGGGGEFALKNKVKRERGWGLVGRGVGIRKGTGKSMWTHLSKLPFSKLPFIGPVFPGRLREKDEGHRERERDRARLIGREKGRERERYIYIYGKREV